VSWKREVEGLLQWRRDSDGDLVANGKVVTYWCGELASGAVRAWESHKLWARDYRDIDEAKSACQAHEWQLLGLEEGVSV
jgi:hypothetical protein